LSGNDTGCHLTVVDVHGLRGQLGHDKIQGSTSSKPLLAGEVGRSHHSGSQQLFRVLPQSQRRILREVGMHRAKGNSSQEPQPEMDSQAPGSTAIFAKSQGSSLGDMQAVASIFSSHCTQLGDLNDVLEDGWGFLLRCPRGSSATPVCAATANVFGADHARIQALVTLPSEKNKGHATTVIIDGIEDFLKVCTYWRHSELSWGIHLGSTEN
jgi:hypothetical protein